MRGIIAAASAITALLVAAPVADAFSYSHFRVNASRTSLTYRVKICGARGSRVTFQAVLARHDGSGRSYTRTWRTSEPYACSTYTLSTNDIWPAGRWDTHLTVYSRGQTVRTRVTVFDNPARARAAAPTG